MFPLFASIAGILLGLHFAVIALVPACLLGTAAFILYNSRCGLDLGASLGPLVFLVIFTQAGYILGLLGREPYARLMTRFQRPLSKRI